MAITGVGRPRLVRKKRPGDTVRDEILDAAAELFSTGGFASTSTRMIATAVGLQQASLYHYFATKDDILDLLLTGTVDTPLAFADRIMASDARASAKMYALTWFDACQLSASRWNLGALYLLPELRTERFVEFRRKRILLMSRYAEIAEQTLSELGEPQQQHRAELPFRMVETVVNVRADSGDGAGRIDADYAEVLADAAIRALGWPEPLAPLREHARQLLTSVEGSGEESERTDEQMPDRGFGTAWSR